MALRDWLNGSGGSAVAVSAVFAAEDQKQDRKTAITATTATAKERKAVVTIDTPTGPRSIPVTGNSAQKMAAGKAPLAADLPAGCPLLGGEVPKGCRFEGKFFKRMLSEGVLPLPGGGCPLRAACRVGR